MSDIDEFATSLLEEAKRFLEKAKGNTDVIAEKAYLHSALMLSFCSLEAHINAIGEEFVNRKEFSPHEKGILVEREVRLNEGEFTMTGLRMYRLEDRIMFLYRHFSGSPLDKGGVWWSQLKNALDLRNKITHPKNVQPVEIRQIEEAIRSIITALEVLYRAIYKKGFPATGLDLQSKLKF